MPDVKPHLRRDIRFAGASLLVLNAVIGAGIFALPGKVAVTAGLLSPWLFLVVGLLFLSVVLTFAELASYFDRSGGSVLYATVAFGPLTGFTTGWLLFGSRMTAFAANANVVGVYLGSLWPPLGGAVSNALIITALTIGLTVANVVGVRNGIRTMAALTLLKVTPLALLVLLGLEHVSAQTLLPDPGLGVENLGGTTLLLIYAYVGFETMAVTAGETHRPRHTLPRALIATVVGTGLLYFLIVLVYVATVPSADYATATLVDVGRLLMGAAGAFVITLAAVFSIGGNLAGSMLSAPRLLYALAENRLLPDWFASVHPRFATPHTCILTMGALALGFALTSSFVELAIASSLSRLLVYAVSVCSLPAVRRQSATATVPEGYRMPGGYTLPAIALLICGWLAANASLDDWLTILVLVAAGLVLYRLARPPLPPVGRPESSG